MIEIIKTKLEELKQNMVKFYMAKIITLIEDWKKIGWGE